MKTQHLTFLILIILVRVSWTQNTNLNFKKAVKFYNLSSFENDVKINKLYDASSNTYLVSSSKLQIFHPTIAFQWKTKKNNFHEIELSSFMLGSVKTRTEILPDSLNNIQTVNGNKITSTAISVRYEYILNLNKSKESKFVPSIGFGINPYFIQNNNLPQVLTMFPSSSKSIGIKTFITPRITYFLTSKLFLDFNIPVCFFNTFYSVEKTENPLFTIQERKIHSFNYQLFPKFISGRFGIGLKI